MSDQHPVDFHLDPLTEAGFLMIWGRIKGNQGCARFVEFLTIFP